MLFTPVTISLTAISPSPLASPAVHADTGVLPKAMFTIVMSSLTATSPLLLQSPTQREGAPVGVNVGVVDGGGVSVWVGVGD